MCRAAQREMCCGTSSSDFSHVSDRRVRVFGRSVMLRGWHRRIIWAMPEPPGLGTESKWGFPQHCHAGGGRHFYPGSPKEGLQELCMNIQASLDVSERGMTKVSHNLFCCCSSPLSHLFLSPFQNPRFLFQCAQSSGKCTAEAGMLIC